MGVQLCKPIPSPLFLSSVTRQVMLLHQAAAAGGSSGAATEQLLARAERQQEAAAAAVRELRSAAQDSADGCVAQLDYVKVLYRQVPGL